MLVSHLEPSSGATAPLSILIPIIYLSGTGFLIGKTAFDWETVYEVPSVLVVLDKSLSSLPKSLLDTVLLRFCDK